MTMMVMVMVMVMMKVKKNNTFKVQWGKVAAKANAVIFGLLKTLGFVFHEVAGTISITGIVPEKKVSYSFFGGIYTTVKDIKKVLEK